MYDATYHNPFVLGLTYVYEIHNCVVYRFYEIFIDLYQTLYNILCLMVSSWFPPGFVTICLHDAFQVVVRQII